MKIRLRFSKMGDIRYVGHLDFMRTFQKILKRCRFDMVYTAGFNPHMVISFAVPLSVGEESLSEYADVDFAWQDIVSPDAKEEERMRDLGYSSDELTPAPQFDEIISRFNENAPCGVEMISAMRVPPLKGSKAMSQVRYADFLIIIKGGKDDMPPDELCLNLDKFIAQNEIITIKKTKSGEKLTDIKPMIKEMSLYDGDLSFIAKYHDNLDDDIIIKIRCAQGSFENLKPMIALNAFFESLSYRISDDRIRIIRLDLLDEEENSLSMYGLSL